MCAVAVMMVSTAFILPEVQSIKLEVQTVEYPESDCQEQVDAQVDADANSATNAETES